MPNVGPRMAGKRMLLCGVHRVSYAPGDFRSSLNGPAAITALFFTFTPSGKLDG
jgi:hypothetical protein